MSSCSVCRYPILGSEQQQATFIAKQITEKSDVEESMTRLQTARKILFGVAAFSLISPFTPLMPDNPMMRALLLFTGLLFIGFALLTHRKPLMALGIPLGVTLVYNLLLLLISPTLFLSGLIWKMLIILGLGFGFISVRKSNIILMKNPYLASTMGFKQIGEKSK